MIAAKPSATSARVATPSFQSSVARSTPSGDWSGFSIQRDFRLEYISQNPTSEPGSSINGTRYQNAATSCQVITKNDMIRNGKDVVMTDRLKGRLRSATKYSKILAGIYVASALPAKTIVAIPQNPSSTALTQSCHKTLTQLSPKIEKSLQNHDLSPAIRVRVLIMVAVKQTLSRQIQWRLPLLFSTAYPISRFANVACDGTFWPNGPLVPFLATFAQPARCRSITRVS